MLESLLAELLPTPVLLMCSDFTLFPLLNKPREEHVSLRLRLLAVSLTGPPPLLPKRPKDEEVSFRLRVFVGAFFVLKRPSDDRELATDFAPYRLPTQVPIFAVVISCAIVTSVSLPAKRTTCSPSAHKKQHGRFNFV